MNTPELPPKQGLYDPQFEHDACGIGMIVNIKGEKSHSLVTSALEILNNLTHRGGVGSEPDTGDGAGILFQIPHTFFQKVCQNNGFSLPDEGEYGVAMLFSSPDHIRAQKSLHQFSDIVKREGLTVLGCREVPIYPTCVGKSAREVCPSIHQIFIGKNELSLSFSDFERKLYIISKIAQREIRYSGTLLEVDPYFYISSLSSKTIVYKGMLLPAQLDSFYLDLKDQDLCSAIALVHSRFSTNTFPSWERAHPIRSIIHNGEINTIRGNVNWVKAREKSMHSTIFGEDLKKVFPVINEDGSDSAMLDDFLQLLYHSGYSLPHAVMMAIPEPWENHTNMDPVKRSFYEYSSCLLEAWDGPAAIAFTDGDLAGATLDRNGLRPSRYYITKDGYVILASEVGVLSIPEENILKKDRLRPGKMLLIDTKKGEVIDDSTIKEEIAKEKPYQTWVNENLLFLPDLPIQKEPGDNWKNLMENKRKNNLSQQPYDQALLKDFTSLENLFTSRSNSFDRPNLQTEQKIFGYTWEDLSLTLKPIAETGDDPVSSMGIDTPLAVLSTRPQLLYSYFKQLFAQVTNPPIDSIREQTITSSLIQLGSEGNLLEPDALNCHMIYHDSPILSEEDIKRIRAIKEPGFRAVTLPSLFNSQEPDSLESAMDDLLQAADFAIHCGYNIIILSDRGVSETKIPIPALLACSGLHHHLIRKGNRTKVSIIVESGEPREVHHFSSLIGYGANAVHPYLVYDSIRAMIKEGYLDLSEKEGFSHFKKAVTKGMVKTMSKMGISTVRSYHGAQIFEALGISEEVVNRYFTGTATRIGGVTLHEIEKETRARHLAAYHPVTGPEPLEAGGDYKWRKDGEYHLYNPESIYLLQQACRQGDYQIYKRFAATINDRSKEIKNIRGLLYFNLKEKPIALDEVEPVESIVRRFKTGAMSYGSISIEAHECMAIAMNRLHGKSNSGEGGENEVRYTLDENKDNRSSAIKQVASGRFGVTIHYLNNATELQIKMAQGAKPGEGGQLPGKKVYPWIAKARHSTPGVELISPPPHHDIYSIEDLAQLIHDLKNANPRARINVKLASEAGVGTIAVGVAKGLADVILVSGYDGGTGAAARGSIRHAGLPWELGIAETHQALILNNLRNRVVLETDGKLLTGRDVAIAALLGAEEFGFATGPLVAIGCDMMRVCNLDTCPVGIATQNPSLREKFQGKPEYVENFMRFIAQDLREWMAKIGLRTIDEMVGHSEYLRARQDLPYDKWKTVDLSGLLYQPKPADLNKMHFGHPQDHHLEEALDFNTLLPLCQKSIAEQIPMQASLFINNTYRTLGALLSSEIVRKYGPSGLPENTIYLCLEGSAGQSFGAFLISGVTFSLLGDCNDYLAKGLSGGRISISPKPGHTYLPAENIIVGNVALYGATSGEVYICGAAGERFAVRNSGATTVVEGVGDHGCEYMTGGTVMILGETGRNFGAGMSGGIAYVYDPKNRLKDTCNAGMILLETPDKNDHKKIKALLESHLLYTGSERAKSLLEKEKESFSQFVKVIPVAYKKALQALDTATKEGQTEDEKDLFVFQAVTQNQ